MNPKDELISKVNALVDAKHGGDLRAAFDKYATDGKCNADAIWTLLMDAGIGNRLTRKLWVREIIAELDRNADAQVSWPEFEAAIKVS